MRKKISGKCLIIVVLAMVMFGSSGCSKALENLVPDPEKLVEQAVQALTGEKKDGKKPPAESPKETKKAEESTESIENAEKPEGESSFQETEVADSESNAGAVADRIVTEEQFLREYAEQCLQQERSLYDYHEKNYMIYREPGAYQGLCFSDTGMLEDIGYDGIISSAICDFDQDSHQELLILRLVQNPPKSQEDMIRTDLEASMYEIEGDQAALADRKPLYEGLNIKMNEFRMEAFIKNTTDGVRLFCETDGSVFIAADGHFWSLRGLEYDGGRFWELADKEFNGSAWEPGDVLPYVENVRSLGLDVTSLLDLNGDYPSILSQDENTLCLASIRRQVKLSYDDYGPRRFSPGDTLEYGSTEIRNHAEGQDALQLPVPGPGSLEPLYQNGVSVSSGGDYILPESSTRILEDAEIAAIPKEQLQMAVNEIYARNGRRFKNKEIQSYFDGKSWYWGTVEPENFDESMLSKIERENIKKLVAAIKR